MTESIWDNLLRFLQIVWTFLAGVFRFQYNPNSTTILPVSSPARGSGIIFTILTPPEQPPSTGSQLSSIPASTWTGDKEIFLRRPTLSRANNCGNKKSEKRSRTRNEKPPLLKPEIFIEDWSSPEIQLSDLLDPTSSTTKNSSMLTPRPPLHEEPSSPSFSPSLNDLTPSDTNDKARDTCNELESAGTDINVNVNTEQGPIMTSFEIPEDVFKISFEPVRYTPDVQSAASGSLWDHLSDVTPASVVPLPLFTSTPPKPYTRSSTDRNSLLPYPDLFDFGIYDATLSQDATSFRFSSYLPDNFPTFESPVLPPATHRDHYRNTGLLRLSGRCNPVKASVETCPSTSRRKTLDSELPLTSILLNSANTRKRVSMPLTVKTQDSPSKCSLDDSSGEWNIISLDDISTRLEEACNDLSRGMWTDEEFLKVIAKW